MIYRTYWKGMPRSRPTCKAYDALINGS